MKVQQIMINQYAQKGEGPTLENVTRIKDVIASTLENFEIVDIKNTREVDEGIPIDDKAHKPIKSKEGKGEFCYKCGLQKEDTQVVEKQGSVIRMCKECLVV